VERKIFEKVNKKTVDSFPALVHSLAMSLTTAEIEQYARMTLKQYGFPDYQVVFMKLEGRRLGQANPWEKKIELSKKTLTTFSLFCFVLKHEIAHCIQFERMGGTFRVNGRNNFHGKVFKQVCREMKIPLSANVPSSLFSD
jgi:predicted SprT family Zn-dependent metalloprotease